MASDDRKIKTKPAPKNDTLPKNKSTPDAAPSKAEGGEKNVDLSCGYSRGEGQKPVFVSVRTGGSGEKPIPPRFYFSLKAVAN